MQQRVLGFVSSPFTVRMASGLAQPEERDPRRHARGRRRMAFVLAGLLVLVGGAAASASSDLFPGGRPTRGLSGAVTLELPAADLIPGGTTRTARVVENTTAATIRYALTSASTDTDGAGIRDALRVRITTPARTAGNGGSCDAGAASTLYEGPLGAATAGFGDAALGQQAGDRELAPGDREILCFEVTTPLGLGNEFQGATTSTTWQVASEQTAGNP
jgi:hypothetical protein